MDKKKCEYCGELIHINTRRCPFCASIVSETPQEIVKAEDEPIEETPKSENSEEGIEQGNEQFEKQVDPIMSPGMKPLTNKAKVFITAAASFIPGLGQLLGIMFAIVFMADENDEDKRTFGKALLTSSLIIFGIVCLCCAVNMISTYNFLMSHPEIKIK